MMTANTLEMLTVLWQESQSRHSVWDESIEIGFNNLAPIIWHKIANGRNSAISLHARAAAFAQAGKELKILEAENHEDT